MQWKVPIVGGSHELISWPLDTDAATLASFGRVPVRSLTDFRLPGGGNGNKSKSKVLRAFTLDAIDIALSLLAPRSVEVGGGIVLFGGEDQPGMVDLKVTGRDPRPRARCAARRDRQGRHDDQGPPSRRVALTADRLHFDGLDQLEVAFDGFSPTAVQVIVHRVTATNLALTTGVGGKSAKPVSRGRPSPRAEPSDQSPPR